MSRENILDPLTFEMPIRFHIRIIKNNFIVVSAYLCLQDVVSFKLLRCETVILNRLFLIKKKRFNVALHAFFISNIFTTNARLILAKNQARDKQHSEGELLLF